MGSLINTDGYSSCGAPIKDKFLARINSLFSCRIGPFDNTASIDQSKIKFLLKYHDQVYSIVFLIYVQSLINIGLLYQTERIFIVKISK